MVTAPMYEVLRDYMLLFRDGYQQQERSENTIRYSYEKQDQIVNY